MIISQTPLRISLCGGGTDFKEYYQLKEGFVVSSAIDKYIFVIIKERFDDLIYVNYTKKEIVSSVDEIQHELVREVLRKSKLDKGIEITMLADVPSEGSGLGSSSSLTVGLLNAAYHYRGFQVTHEQLAKEACEIEIDTLKKPIGKQDQYIAAYGGLKAIKFNKDETVETEAIELPTNLKRKLGANLLLFYTNITRSSSTVLTEQKKSISDKLDYHDSIKKLAYDTEGSLLNGNVDDVGRLLSENWDLKKNLSSNISNAEIDKMYSTAINAGAVGGKIAGAGGGGFLLVYCKREDHDKLREAMQDYREMPFMLEPQGSKIIFNYKRYDLK
ncbi:MAG: GHMP kinase [Ignavibacteriales bacterium]|nr:MAG: GHMP kinase [Ignavibacteriales bacterium]